MTDGRTDGRNCKLSHFECITCWRAITITWMICSQIHYICQFSLGCEHLGESNLNWQSYCLYCRAVHGTAPLYLLLWSATPRCWHHIKMPSPVVDLLWTGHPSVVACKRPVGDRSFAVAGPGLWNTLPEDLHLCRFYWYFDENWKRICFGKLIRILYCTLFGLLRPVVLEVITYLDIFKNYNYNVTEPCWTTDWGGLTVRYQLYTSTTCPCRWY